MLDRLLARLSLRRSTAGIYYELRTLRQMAEIYFDYLGLELPVERRRRDKSPADIAVDQPDEHELARREVDRIRRAELEGRDPGTTYRPDPNR